MWTQTINKSTLRLIQHEVGDKISSSYIRLDCIVSIDKIDTDRTNITMVNGTRYFIKKNISDVVKDLGFTS